MSYKIVILLIVSPFVLLGHLISPLSIQKINAGVKEHPMACCAHHDQPQKETCNMENMQNNEPHQSDSQDCDHNSCNHNACCMLVSQVWFFTPKLNLTIDSNLTPKNKNLFGIKNFNSVDINFIWIPPKIIA